MTGCDGFPVNTVGNLIGGLIMTGTARLSELGEM
jgi:hypothetical protein